MRQTRVTKTGRLGKSISNCGSCVLLDKQFYGSWRSRVMEPRFLAITTTSVSCFDGQKHATTKLHFPILHTHTIVSLSLVFIALPTHMLSLSVFPPTDPTTKLSIPSRQSHGIPHRHTLCFQHQALLRYGEAGCTWPTAQTDTEHPS